MVYFISYGRVGKRGTNTVIRSDSELFSKSVLKFRKYVKSHKTEKMVFTINKVSNSVWYEVCFYPFFGKYD